MNSNITIFGVAAAGMSRTLDAQIGAHPAHPVAAKAAAAPRKRRAAAATAVASVRGFI
jgi:hypothetical protein